MVTSEVQSVPRVTPEGRELKTIPARNDSFRSTTSSSTVVTVSVALVAFAGMVTVCASPSKSPGDVAIVGVKLTVTSVATGRAGES